MRNRREILIVGASAAGGLLVPASSAAVRGGAIKIATAITQVFGGGQRFTAIVLDYGKAMSSKTLSPADFSVAGRTIRRVYANEAASLSDKGRDGPFVVIELSASDPDAVLYALGKPKAPPGGSPMSGPPSGPPAIMRRAPQASIMQVRTITAADGSVVPASGPVSISSVKNLVVDDFVQRTFAHKPSGKTLGYNLFIPKSYDPAKSYPLINFMHDAGVTGPDPMLTLVQGNGAIVFASPQDQAKRPAFVLAPQFPEPFVNDKSEDSVYLDMVVDLIEALSAEFSIDRNRLYTTGQSGGGMLSIAINIKYPDLFAASYLVACQWAPDLCAPLAKQAFWIVVSQGDAKAYPGQNAIMDVIEPLGAKVSRAVWDGRADEVGLAAAARALEDKGTPILYAAFKSGTVLPTGDVPSPGGEHTGTWRVAYGIEPIREWLFKQVRTA
jgi:predicted peptidase